MANTGMRLYMIGLHFLGLIKHLFIRGKAKNHLFGSKDLSFSVVALSLNFKRPRSQSFLGFCIVDCGSCAQCNNC